jgi:hypothetical protein
MPDNAKTTIADFTSTVIDAAKDGGAANPKRRLPAGIYFTHWN